MPQPCQEMQGWKKIAKYAQNGGRREKKHSDLEEHGIILV